MIKQFRTLLLLALTVSVVVSCQSAPKKDLALEQIRSQLDQLQSDPELTGYASSARGEAERALRSAENATGNETQRNHLIYMADRRIQIARAAAQREKMESELERLRLDNSHLLVSEWQREKRANGRRRASL